MPDQTSPSFIARPIATVVFDRRSTIDIVMFMHTRMSHSTFFLVAPPKEIRPPTGERGRTGSTTTTMTMNPIHSHFLQVALCLVRSNRTRGLPDAAAAAGGERARTRARTRAGRHGHGLRKKLSRPQPILKQVEGYVAHPVWRHASPSTLGSSAGSSKKSAEVLTVAQFNLLNALLGYCLDTPTRLLKRLEQLHNAADGES